MKKFYLAVILLAVLLFFMINLTYANENFYAYHTKVQHSATDYFGKFADIIVVLGEDKQLEFTRRTENQPLWRTKSGTYLIDDLYPGRDRDYEFFYNYVRLIETSPQKIVVHWRYFPDIQTLERANREKNPLEPHGFLGGVHELFTIYPDGKVERAVKDAQGSTIEDWKNPNLAIKQTITLKDDGIDFGKVNWGRGQREYDEEEEEEKFVKKWPVIEADNLPKPAKKWSLNKAFGESAAYTDDSAGEEESEIEGLSVTYKKGVSGSALVFDGYYTAITQYRNPEINDQLSIDAWLALDVYPYNDAPVVHQSQKTGEKGYYFGIDPYGYPFMRLNGSEVKSKEKLPLYKWQHLAVTVGNGKINLYQNGKSTASGAFSGKIDLPDVYSKIGLNTEKLRCTDYVRDFPQNLPFILGIQGVMDEVNIYDKTLSPGEIAKIYQTYRPDDLSSPVAIGVLPGEIGTASKFGAYYKTLPFQETWDNMWRLSDYADVVVKFDHIPTSVVYWHGSNYAANWITDANQWMSDQSSEIWGPHGCSEHMADKQLRNSYVRIIENTSARVVVHWRYPCVDVGYVCTDKLNWSDEYHTIYPDGTGIRKVVWNKGYDTPGFQDIQFFTNPGETALDVVDLQAMTVANINGDVEELMWAKPNVVPKITIKDATIELLNSKSKYKIFVIFQGGNITPWGSVEQSKYTDDPFAGPWNHWPMHFVPSDGRFAVDHDRVTHFALGANDYAPQFGSLVHYGYTDQSIRTAIPYARFWQNPPQVNDVSGGKSYDFNKDEKAYIFKMEGEKLSFTIDADKNSPLVNPAFVIRHWEKMAPAKVVVDGKEVRAGKTLRQGDTRCAEGQLVKVIWLEMASEKPIKVEISRR
jgi:hypothetical protein